MVLLTVLLTSCALTPETQLNQLPPQLVLSRERIPANLKWLSTRVSKGLQLERRFLSYPFVHPKQVAKVLRDL